MVVWLDQIIFCDTQTCAWLPAIVPFHGALLGHVLSCLPTRRDFRPEGSSLLGPSKGRGPASPQSTSSGRSSERLTRHSDSSLAACPFAGFRGSAWSRVWLLAVAP